MPPIHNYSSWNKRFTEETDPIEPYKKFFFICEGANTENWYFEKLIDLRKELGIHPMIELCLLERTGEDINNSAPKKLLEYARQQKKNAELKFNKKTDKMIVVFDADVFRKKPSQYTEIILQAEEDGDIPAVTNPAFELFLLLHFPESYQTDIEPNRIPILQNEKVGNQTFIYQLLRNRTGINSKTNRDIGKLAIDIDIAIQQEKLLNQDIAQCPGNLTSNIGKIIDEIRKQRVAVSN